MSEFPTGVSGFTRAMHTPRPVAAVSVDLSAWFRQREPVWDGRSKTKWVCIWARTSPWCSK